MRLWRGIWWVETRREASGVRLSSVIVNAVENAILIHKYVLVEERKRMGRIDKNLLDILLMSPGVARVHATLKISEKSLK
jgi:hypothetical protein